MPPKKTTLANGITIMTESMPQVRSISMGLWYNVGSRDERIDQAGLTHFMEHMMFKGTPTRTAVEISSQFDAIGADLNAFTSKEYTCYHARFVDEKLKEAMPIFADMVINSSFSNDTIEPEREVVIEEIARSEDTPDDHVFDLFSDTLLPNHPLGRPVLGTRESVSSYNQAKCRDFHDEHYCTGNLVLAAVGNLDHDEVVRLAEKHFGGMVQGNPTMRDRQAEPNRSYFALQQKDTEQAHIIYGFPWMDAESERRYAGTLLAAVLGGSMSSRLFQEIREKNGLAYSVFSQAVCHYDLGEFYIYCGTRPDNLQKAVAIVRRELEKIAHEAPTQEEVDRQREVICGQLLLGLESTNGRMVRMGRAATMGVEYKSAERLVEIYRGLTPEDVRNVAADYLTVKPTIALVSPFSEEQAREQVGLD